MKEDIATRIGLLRDAMQQAGVDAVIIPQTDQHQGEYLADHWQVRRWLSGFTGSAGDLVVTRDNAFVWADSRYWLQAAAQLKGTPIAVMEDGKPETPSIAQWIVSNLPSGSTVGIDGMLFSVNSTDALESELKIKGINLVVDFNPIDDIWTDRPALPKNEVFIHDIKYAGQSATDKIAAILENTKSQQATSTFISDLAEIAWTLNLRSSDVDCNPVLTSFLYLAPEESTLFIDSDKLTPEVRDHLSEAKVGTLPYTGIITFLKSLPASSKVLLSAGQSAGALLKVLGSKAVVGSSPVALLKAVKNPVQLDGVRNTMIRDGIALVDSFMEIEETLANGGSLTEIDVADILLRNRKTQPLFFDLSFETIAGYGPHGAIVHYSANKETNATIHPDGLLLIDSGANYLDGTTDITRTIALGSPTNAQRHDFTLVMKGHIAIAQAVFPIGTTGHQLDALARINLWKEGLSYLHGTGHGVGHFLNVHEGPQSIRLNDTKAPILPGMITSNEPGLYREGEYGIRCENLVLAKEAFRTGFGEFIDFEVLTLFPFDVALLDTDLLTDSEIEWINAYHALVCQRLLPHLSAKAQQWLISKTPKVERN